jgi:hypothetical protein
MLLGRHKSAFLSRPTSPTGNEPLTAIFRISDPSPVPLPASENLAKRELPVWFRVRQIQRSSGHPGPAEWRGTRRRQTPSSSAPVAAQLLRAGGRPPLVPRLAGPHSEGRAPRPPPGPAPIDGEAEPGWRRHRRRRITGSVCAHLQQPARLLVGFGESSVPPRLAVLCGLGTISPCHFMVRLISPEMQTILSLFGVGGGIFG